MGLLLVLMVCVMCHALADNVPPSCDSRIYCHGDLLHTIQMAQIFNDSKSFVDMKKRRTTEDILENFQELMSATGGFPSKQEIAKFVSNNFEEGNELEKWSPPDYNPEPAFIKDLSDESVREFARTLISIWPQLARKVKPEVGANNSQYSIIPVPNGFIIPGGRFREYYYWDTYWIINGLIISEMYETARGMLDNFITLIAKYGFIPNGGRIYYEKRSQPPLFTPMVAQYFKKARNEKGTKRWLKNNIMHLETELKFWLNHRMVNVSKNGQVHTLARYFPESLGPRPESYREDYLTALSFDKSEQQRVYTDLKGGAESGWDFSSRWLYDKNGGVVANLTHIYTSRTIPVDLNSFLYRAFDDISYLYVQLVDRKKAAYWKVKAKQMRHAINEIFWNQNDGVWYDFDNQLRKHRQIFSVSNLAPLWSGAFDRNNQDLSIALLRYLEERGIFDYLGGTPSTLEHTGEQWDFPNAWPPLQAILVQGLANLKTNKAELRARELAKIWLDANMLGYNQTKEMFEKYDAQSPGQYGGGGEYIVQSGFGWTNGVALEFLNTYFKNN